LLRLPAGILILNFPKKDQHLILFLSSTGEALPIKSHKIAAELEELFFDSRSKGSDFLKEGIAFLKERIDEFENSSFILATILKNILYFYAEGDVDAYLLRNNSKLNLSAGKLGKIVSGRLQEGDKVLFVTENLKEKADLATLNTSNLADEIEYLSSKLQLRESIACFLISVEKKRVVEKISNPFAYPLRIQVVSRSWKKPLLNTLNLLKPKNKKGLGIYLILSLVLLTCSTLYIRYLQKNSQTNQQTTTLVNSSRSYFAAAQNLRLDNPEEARNNFLAAKKDLDKALKIKPKDSKLLDLQNEFNLSAKEILREFEVKDFPVFLNLSLIRDGFSTKRLSYSKGNVLVLDEVQKTLVLIDLQSKSPKILSGGEKVGNAYLASVNGDYNFTFSPDKGVVRVDKRAQGVLPVIPVDSDWSKIADLVGFANNVYLLDEFKNQIWKYIPTQSGYSEKYSYFNDETKADLAGSLKMQINGSVWVLKQGNEILKFTAGVRDFFAVANLDTELGNVTSFYVSDETDRIYLLDRGNSRVVVLKKNGIYDYQLIGERFKTTDDLIADEEGKKLYLLEGNKIYLVGTR